MLNRWCQWIARTGYPVWYNYSCWLKRPMTQKTVIQVSEKRLTGIHTMLNVCRRRSSPRAFRQAMSKNSLGMQWVGKTRFSSHCILIPSLNLRNVHTQKEALVIKFGYLVRERSFCMKLPGAYRWTNISIATIHSTTVILPRVTIWLLWVGVIKLSLGILDSTFLVIMITQHVPCTVITQPKLDSNA